MICTRRHDSGPVIVIVNVIIDTHRHDDVVTATQSPIATSNDRKSHAIGPNFLNPTKFGNNRQEYRKVAKM